ncbi:MAG: translation initiation factor IF-2 [Paludibacteraceae bacterium]|nr:translation initiation factor IF-2 [Paludibacteraceae bacterium]
MAIKLVKVCQELHISMNDAREFFEKQGITVDVTPNTRIDDDQQLLLVKAYDKEWAARLEAERQAAHAQPEKAATAPVAEAPKKKEPEFIPTEAPAAAVQLKVVGNIDLEQPKTAGPKKADKPSAPKKEQTKADKPHTEPATPAKPAESAQPVKPAEPVEPAKPKVELAKTPGDRKAEAAANQQLKVVGKIDLSAINQATHPTKKTKEEKKRERIEREQQRKAQQANSGKSTANAGNSANNGNADNTPNPANGGEKRKRERIHQGRVDVNDARNQRGGKKKDKHSYRVEIDDDEIRRNVKSVNASLNERHSKSMTSIHKNERRKQEQQKRDEQRAEQQAMSTVLKLTEFVTANDLATMMNVPVTKVIGTCMMLGVMVSINQRLDAETINLVAEEFGFTTEYVSAKVTEEINADEEVNEEDITERCPIVTVMGHVDHGKTSLLDHIRNTNVIAGEAGGITQHIGAYNVELKNGRHITFLDTPGHEAFTAMRARGAKVTDIAIIIVAADDAVMPQTIEAINHAQAAGVPMIFAINKCDKPGANPDKIKEQLSNMNILVEEWGGKYQSQDISAKSGMGIFELLEKVLLEADMLELKANPKRRAKGSIIESTLDKGRGYVATILVSDGTLHMGDIVLAGTFHGKIKAMFNERGQKISQALPGEPAVILGLNGAPQAGDEFNVLPTEQEAREIANKREQLQREQSIRTKKHIGLDEIGRRLAIGDFKEINLIVKGDVDGSVEALSDSLIKLSTENIQVNVIHGAVGAISDSDIMLAAASNAIIVGFNVRPTGTARKMAEEQEVDIRLYSIIYDAIEELKAAMAGMLSPEIKEEVTATLEVLQTFHISKVGTIAGCIVREGKAKRSNKCRIIRDGIVIHTGELSSLKHGKDDIKEVGLNQECGLSIKSFNDVQEGDMVETYETVEVAKSL